MRRLKRLAQKLPYDLYEYNPTGTKLISNERTETAHHNIANEITRFLNLIIPNHIKIESNEKAIANMT